MGSKRRDQNTIEMLGRHVVAWREHVGISQAELSRRVGATAGAVSRVESGHGVSVTFLAEIASALGVSLGTLVGGMPARNFVED